MGLAMASRLWGAPKSSHVLPMLIPSWLSHHPGAHGVVSSLFLPHSRLVQLLLHLGTGAHRPELCWPDLALWGVEGLCL